jgi:hypothetical protein
VRGLSVLLGIFAMVIPASAAQSAAFKGERGTLAIFIPTNSGWVIAADQRQSPKEGIFCDGINKILLPERAEHTAVVITGNITLSDMPDLPPAELCEHLKSTPAPIDFGRITLAFLDSENVPLSKFDGQKFTDTIFAAIHPFVAAGNLKAFFGTRVANIVISHFDPATTTSSLLAFGIDLDSIGAFRLQPLPVTASTTLSGTDFNLTSHRVLLPFGEVPYFHQYVLTGTGQAHTSEAYEQFLQKARVSDVTPDLAGTVAIALIEATAKATEQFPAPSGIGGGTTAALIGSKTTWLRQ